MTMGTWLAGIRVASCGLWQIGTVLLLVRPTTPPTFVLSTLFC
jgi:hypothetical protein